MLFFSLKSPGIIFSEPQYDNENMSENVKLQSFTNAVSIETGQTVINRLHDGWSVKNYSFDITNDGYIGIDFEHENILGTHFGWRVRLYDDQSRLLEEFFSRHNDEKVSSANTGLAAGSYYIQVDFNRSGHNWTHSNIDYQLTVRKPHFHFIPPPMGDVDGDRNITVNDAILVLRHIVGLIVLGSEQLNRAKVSGSIHLTVTDAIMILRHIVGLIEDF